MGELFLGAKRGTEVGCSRAADGTGYGHGLLRKTQNRGRKEERKEGRYRQRGGFSSGGFQRRLGRERGR